MWPPDWAMVSALGTLATAGVAGWQIWQLRWDQKGRETLKACERYESDPVLDRALCALRDARISGALAKAPKNYSLEATTVLNYLDGIAIGVKQGFYNEAVVRDHLEPIMTDHVRELITDFGRDMHISPDSFPKLLGLLEKWKQDRTYYGGWFK